MDDCESERSVRLSSRRSLEANIRVYEQKLHIRQGRNFHEGRNVKVRERTYKELQER